jgi:toxin ParE1/3/4
MARKVTWTKSAWIDLDEVADYIGKDSPNYAGAFVREVRDAARSLASLPERGRIVPEFNDPSIRELFVRSYHLIYQVTVQTVYILLDLSMVHVIYGHFGSKKDDNVLRTSANRVLEINTQRLRPSQELETLCEIPNPAENYKTIEYRC